MRRIKITLSYDGGPFHGWQVQPNLSTIQGLLEEILAGVEKAPVQVAGSGRTDAGVHALEQVAAFTLQNRIPVENLKRAINRLLPPAIRILTVEEAGPDFHPRFQAKAKTYEYRLFRGEICSPFHFPYVHHHPYKLDEAAMVQLAAAFQGEHDFTVFAAAEDDRDAQGKSKVRRIFSSNLTRHGDLLIYRVRGSGFLKHMVRNIVGTLIEAGKGNVADLSVLPQKCGPTAPAKGLFLVNVEY